MDLNTEETTGTLVVLGLPVLTGLYAQTGEQRVAWLMRVPVWLRWACFVKWHLTWTPLQEKRDAIGRAIAMAVPPPTEADHLCGLLRQVAARHEPPNVVVTGTTRRQEP